MPMISRGRDSRRRALKLLVVAALVGAALLEVARRYRPDFEAWVRSDPRLATRLIMPAMCLALVGPLLVLSISLWIDARRQAAGGRSLRMAAAFLALSGLALAWSLWRLFALILGSMD